MKKSITIGIAAYNCQDNIASLLKSLLAQKKTGLEITRILVYCDQCTDATATKARSVKNPKISVIEGRVRAGFAGAVNDLLGRMRADINLLLNDDIKIAKTDFLEKLTRPFFDNPKVGLVTGNPWPLAPRTFVEKAIISATNVYEKTLTESGNIHRVFTCDGKVMALSRKFRDNLNVPIDRNKFGNVDAYMYFSCIRYGWLYRNVPEARVWFRQPSTLGDWIRLVSRDNAQLWIDRQTFGPGVEAEYKFPKDRNFWKNALREAVNNPLGCLSAMAIGAYGRNRAKRYSQWLTATWQVNTSSKALH